jgi:UDP:flavonoid glycosyltransferase YjiC (YdhE family)
VRVAVVAGPDPGHAFPAVALAIALRHRGATVLVATGPRWHDRVRAEGLEAVDIPLLAPDPRDVDFGFRIWGRARLMAPLLSEQLAPWRPDRLVSDTLTAAGGFAAGLLGVPWAELVPHPLAVPSRALPPPGSGLTPGRTPIGRTRDALLRRAHDRSYALSRQQRAAARTALGLDPAAGPNLRLVATLPGLELRRPDWPASTEVVGPLEWDPATGDLAAPDGDGPLVVVSDSTASGRSRALTPLALAALAGTGLRLACTQLEPYAGQVPAGCVAGPGRQAPLLAAAAVAVCSGGHGLVAKALARGVPLVVVPGPGDQRDNAARVVRLGAGLSIPPTKLTGARLTAAVGRVLADPSYAAAARRIARTGDGLGAHRAAELVESLPG